MSTSILTQQQSLSAIEVRDSTDFYQLTPDQQGDQLAKMAQHALSYWQLAADHISLIKYRENAVFSVHTTTGERYALRIHRPGYHDDVALRSELQWMSALADSGVKVPEVIPTPDQQLMVKVSVPEVPEPRQIDLFAWVEGQPLGSVEHGLGSDLQQVAKIYYNIGNTAARVHNQASQWPLPEGFQRHAWDLDGLVGEAPFWGRFWELESLTTEQQQLLEQARDKARKELASFNKNADNYGLIHADFVPENLMTDGENVRLIDFDDAGFGWHLFELATALYFIQEEPSYDTAKTALLWGYNEQRPLKLEDIVHLELFLTLRGFTYLGWIRSRQETETAQEMTPDLVRRACKQAERYLALD